MTSDITHDTLDGETVMAELVAELGAPDTRARWRATYLSTAGMSALVSCRDIGISSKISSLYGKATARI
jgi:hypothetical protein